MITFIEHLFLVTVKQVATIIFGGQVQDFGEDLVSPGDNNDDCCTTCICKSLACVVDLMF